MVFCSHNSMIIYITLVICITLLIMSRHDLYGQYDHWCQGSNIYNYVQKVYTTQRNNHYNKSTLVNTFNSSELFTIPKVNETSSHRMAHTRDGRLQSSQQLLTPYKRRVMKKLIMEVTNRSAISNHQVKEILPKIHTTDKVKVAPKSSNRENKLKVHHEKKKMETFLTRDFNSDLEYIFIFLHIQKTGGSLLMKHMTTNMDFKPACQCDYKHKVAKVICQCANRHGRQWLFHRDTMGWLCGVHPDWTVLHDCVAEQLDKFEKHHRTRRYYMKA